MKRIETYEFHVFGATPEGLVPAEPVRVERVDCFGILAVKNVTRSLVREVRGPVDVALVGATPGDNRYVFTGTPRWPGNPRSRAVVFERLD
jgi:hypothetical protein